MLADKIEITITREDAESALSYAKGVSSTSIRDCLVAQAIKRVTGKENQCGYSSVTIFDVENKAYEDTTGNMKNAVYQFDKYCLKRGANPDELMELVQGYRNLVLTRVPPKV